MITKQQAMTHFHFHHVRLKNADGTPVRCRANGKCKTWVTRPDDFRLPVKYGLRQCFYITPSNADEWLTEDTEHERLAKLVGLSPDVPIEILHDRLLETGNIKE